MKKNQIKKAKDVFNVAKVYAQFATPPALFDVAEFYITFNRELITKSLLDHAQNEEKLLALFVLHNEAANFPDSDKQLLSLPQANINKQRLRSASEVICFLEHVIQYAQNNGMSLASVNSTLKSFMKTLITPLDKTTKKEQFEQICQSLVLMSCYSLVEKIASLAHQHYIDSPGFIYYKILGKIKGSPKALTKKDFFCLEGILMMLNNDKEGPKYGPKIQQLLVDASQYMGRARRGSAAIPAQLASLIDELELEFDEL